MIIKMIGWTPITHARMNESEVYIERFGDINSSMFYTIWNVSDSPKNVMMKINRKGLNLTGQFLIKYLISSSPEQKMSLRVWIF